MKAILAAGTAAVTLAAVLAGGAAPGVHLDRFLPSADAE